MPSSRFTRCFPEKELLYPERSPDDLTKVIGEYVNDNEVPTVPWRVRGLLGLVPGSRPGTVRCKTVVVDRAYVDKDYIEAYSAFYGGLYRDYARTCRRFHFFRDVIDEDDFLEPSDEKKARLQGAYLGYSAAHDLGSSVVGSTVVAVEAEQTDGSSTIAVSCSWHEANVLGYQLRVCGFPFVQQDGRVAACASSSLWMAANSFSRYLGTGVHISPSEITDAATRYSTPRKHSFLDPGLRSEQIQLVLNDMGYDPAVFGCPGSASELRSVVSKYSMSGIPVILVLEHANGGLHAVTVSGFVYDQSGRNRGQPSLETKRGLCQRRVKYYPCSSRVTDLLVHDDQSGPYVRLSLSDGRAVEVGHLDAVLHSATPFGESANGNVCVTMLVVPLPPKVYSIGERAQWAALRFWLTAGKLYSLMDSLPTETILYTYLVCGDTFKDRLQDARLVSRLPTDLVNCYRGMGLHRLLWVTEFAARDNWRERSLTDVETVGEIVLDSTMTTFDRSFVALHLPPKYVRMQPHDTDCDDCMLSPLDIVDDQSAHPLLWPSLVRAD